MPRNRKSVSRGATETTPLERAQDLMYDAWDFDDPVMRRGYAETALTISADCADAFVLLGDEKATSAAEARAYFEEAVRAGERALGKAVFEEEVGHFWGILETRPYMRARLRLAQNAKDLGDLPAAVAHMKELLRLNPNDNQGIRFLLLGALVEADDDVGVSELLAAYDGEGAASWLYDKALSLIRGHAAEAQITTAVDEAFAANRFVPALILGKKRMPREHPLYIGYCDEREAIAYAWEAKRRWVATIGALERLRQTSSRRRKNLLRELQ